ncbi:MarR family winged helix-turn-helix transcriptional regulator [Bosea sp. BIWAKO-01]|uniref:MarR family winged helix-turn-helix transcriptional regulator n=1 Tax=Bosea sp. BIWAKO-01 TaxID=506668 RepID=UPI0008539B00|nr:MarR family transcriptional regulator [Bosea sp. BIWAKO-01]GAU84564.1 transcriptional regulator of MarR family [Bosea sp. BIWAKO-01]
MRRPLKRELVFQLLETSRQLRSYVDQRARENGTTRAQWSVLARLRRAEGLNQATLAEMLELQPISLTRLIDRLEGQELVERRLDLQDRRARLLHLTSAGRKLVDDLDGLRAEIAGEIFDGVDETALATTLATLGSVRNKLRLGLPERAEDKLAARRVPAGGAV